MPNSQPGFQADIDGPVLAVLRAAFPDMHVDMLDVEPFEDGLWLVPLPSEIASRVLGGIEFEWAGEAGTIFVPAP